MLILARSRSIPNEMNSEAIWMLEAQVHVVAGYNHLGYLRVLFDNTASAYDWIEKYAQGKLSSDIRLVVREHDDEHQSISEPYIENIMKLASHTKGTRICCMRNYSNCYALELQQSVNGEWMSVGLRENLYLKKEDALNSKKLIESYFNLSGWRHVIRCWNGEIRELQNSVI